MQMSYLYASDFPFKTFGKLAQQAETTRKNVWKKSNDANSSSIRVQTTIIHISICFSPQYQRHSVFFFRAGAEKGIARRIARLATIVVKFNTPLFRDFYNHLSNYTKTIIRLRLVNVGEYSRA